MNTQRKLNLTNNKDEKTVFNLYTIQQEENKNE